MGNCRRAHPKYIRISTNSPPYKKMELRKTWESLKVLSEVAVVVVVVPLAGKSTKSSSVASSRRSSKWRTMVHVVVYCCLPASFYFSAFLCLARCWTEMTVILMFACLSAELLYGMMDRAKRIDSPCRSSAVAATAINHHACLLDSGRMRMQGLR